MRCESQTLEILDCHGLPMAFVTFTTTLMTPSYRPSSPRAPFPPCLQLNDVIASWFDLVGSTLELLILVPVLFILSIELSVLLVIIVPPFVYLQLRSGAFIVVAAQEVRTTETNFSKFMEENIVFASTRKLLGLGRSFDLRLKALQEQVVEKFDVLDVFEARSQMQIDAFSMALGAGVFCVGVALMNMEVHPHSPLQGVSMPSTCLLMPEALCSNGESLKPNGDVCPPPGSGRKFRLDLSTLFAFVAGVQGVFPICAAFIGAIRRIQVGTSSYTRVSEFMNVDPEPFEAHALHMNYRDAPSANGDKDGLLWLKGVVSDPSAPPPGASTAGPARVLEVAVTHVEPNPPSKVFGVVTNEEGVITAFASGGAVDESDGLRIGDRILEINDKVMDGESMNPIDQPIANSRGSQIGTLLAKLFREQSHLERVDFLVRRGEAAAVAAIMAAHGTSEDSHALVARLDHGSGRDSSSAPSSSKAKRRRDGKKTRTALTPERVTTGTQTLAAEFWRDPPRLKGPAIVLSNITYVSRPPTLCSSPDRHVNPWPQSPFCDAQSSPGELCFPYLCLFAGL